MTVTDVKVRSIIEDHRTLRAIVSVVIDGDFTVHDVKVIRKDGREFVSMPSRRDENGVWRDIVHPIGQEARGKLERAVLGAYHEALEEQHGGLA